METKKLNIPGQKGFTMIELLIVMTVVGALAAVVLVAYPASQKRARDTIRRSDLKQYQTALEIYANNNSGNYPNSSGDLASVCSSDLSQYTSSCPDDPDGVSTYEYVYSSGSYYVFAELEAPDTSGTTQYQYFCSNGNSGQTNSDPGSTNPC